MKPKKYTQPRDFTEDEIEYLLNKCNFVNHEKVMFEMRARGCSISEVADVLNLSVEHAYHISQKVNKKIRRVL